MAIPTWPNWSRSARHFTLLACIILIASCGRAGNQEKTLHIAVASNFKTTLEEMVTVYSEKSGADVKVTAGSTGKLYAQITNGAPFDVFLSADELRPKLLEENGNAISETRMTYAIGQLALWSPSRAKVDLDTLQGQDFTHLAIANPDLAPYGLAAHQVMEGLGIADALNEKRVLGENIGQAFAFVQTGNADIGFVAWSQLVHLPATARGSFFMIDADLHDPIGQDAVLVRDTSDGRAFLDFLKSEKARKIIQEQGYSTP